MTKSRSEDRHKDKLLPIRAPEGIHRRLKQAAEAMTERNRQEDRLGRVTASEVGLAAVREYLKRLEAEGIIPHEDDETID